MYLALTDTKQDSLINLRSRCPMICKSDTVSFSWPSECIHACGRHVCVLATSLVQRMRHSDLHMKTRSNATAQPLEVIPKALPLESK